MKRPVLALEKRKTGSAEQIQSDQKRSNQRFTGDHFCKAGTTLNRRGKRDFE